MSFPIEAMEWMYHHNTDIFMDIWQFEGRYAFAHGATAFRGGPELNSKVLTAQMFLYEYELNGFEYPGDKVNIA